MRDWQVVLDRQPFDFFRACRGAARSRLLRVFEELENNPTKSGAFERRDEVGRTIQIAVLGKFQIHFWDDFSVKELRIARLERMP